ncbi:hypothetical protein [Corallococcus sp. CA054B]|uniref:hypothetical protein n=1 Tax=Corallococcus sp. CA054B TaxID=2316734 RepID=UPI0011C361FC|nr:hypothetical protein [Corallococcus sp. CA054B]
MGAMTAIHQKRRNVIPTKPAAKKAEQTGAKKRVITFKPDDDISEYVDGVVATGMRQTDVIEKSLRIVRDLATSLGIEDWAEVEKRARVKGVTEGVIVAELIRPLLASVRTEEPSAKPRK